MDINQLLNNVLQYISDAVGGIFTPDRDNYPIVGIQPFEGEPYQEKLGLDW